MIRLRRGDDPNGHVLYLQEGDAPADSDRFAAACVSSDIAAFVVDRSETPFRSSRNVPVVKLTDLLRRLAERGHTGDDDGFLSALSEVARGLRVDDPVQAMRAAGPQVICPSCYGRGKHSWCPRCGTHTGTHWHHDCPPMDSKPCERCGATGKVPADAPR